MAKSKEVKFDANGKRLFGMRDKVSYAAGDLGCNMSFALKNTIMFVFWSQFMQLGETLYATLLLVVQIWDAINDWTYILRFILLLTVTKCSTCNALYFIRIRLRSLGCVLYGC